MGLFYIPLVLWFFVLWLIFEVKKCLQNKCHLVAKHGTKLADRCRGLLCICESSRWVGDIIHISPV